MFHQITQLILAILGSPKQDAEVKDLEHEIRQRRHSAVLKEEKFPFRIEQVVDLVPALVMGLPPLP